MTRPTRSRYAFGWSLWKGLSVKRLHRETVKGEPHSRVTYSIGVRPIFEAVMIQVEKEKLAVSTNMTGDVNPHLIAGELLLAASSVEGIHPGDRVRILALSSMFMAHGVEDLLENGPSSDENDRPF